MVDSLERAKDEKPASRFDVDRDPSAAALDHTTLDDAKRDHWCQTRSATQQRGVEDRTQEQVRAHAQYQDNVLSSQANGPYLEGSDHVLTLSCQVVLVSCARYLVDPFDVKTHRLPSLMGCWVVDCRPFAAMTA